MQPTSQHTSDKGKGITSSSSQDIYFQTMLGNVRFRPQNSIELQNSMQLLERIDFGPFNLIVFPPGNYIFNLRPEHILDRLQKCLIDNLWIAHHKPDHKHF